MECPAPALHFVVPPAGGRRTLAGMDTIPHPHDARCTTHGLAAGPDGQCVLCRRQAAPAPADGGSGRLVIGLLAALIVCVGGALGYRAIKRVTLALSAPPIVAADEGPPPTTLAEATARVHVTLYSTSWCPHCKRAKAWLTAKGYTFDERDVEESIENRRAYEKVSSARTVPVLDVDGRVMVGFAPEQVEEEIRASAERRLARR